MGLYDSVTATCTCGAELEWQSKEGDCVMADFLPERVPRAIAYDVIDAIEVCRGCGKGWKLAWPEIEPEFMAMQAVEL